MGNTCFIDVIIQCLNSTEMLTDFLAKLDQDGKLEGISNELNFLSNVMKSSEFRTVTPLAFKRELQLANPTFNGNKQHDAQEALNTILECIEKEGIKNLKNNKILEQFNGEIKPLIKKLGYVG